MYSENRTGKRFIWNRNKRKEPQGFYQPWGSYLAPPVGLEPTTSWLTVMRSTDWAIEEYWKGSDLRSLPQRRPIFPGSCPPSIFGTAELNYCVRYGYRCALCAIVTELPKYDISLISSYLPIDKLSLIPFLPWSSPRSISNAQLNTLLHLHLRPINHIVYVGPYYLSVWDILS